MCFACIFFFEAILGFLKVVCKPSKRVYVERANGVDDFRSGLHNFLMQNFEFLVGPKYLRRENTVKKSFCVCRRWRKLPWNHSDHRLGRRALHLFGRRCSSCSCCCSCCRGCLVLPLFTSHRDLHGGLRWLWCCLLARTSSSASSSARSSARSSASSGRLLSPLLFILLTKHLHNVRRKTSSGEWVVGSSPDMLDANLVVSRRRLLG